MPNLASIISSSCAQMPPFPWRASHLSCTDEVHISHEQITPGACPLLHLCPTAPAWAFLGVCTGSPRAAILPARGRAGSRESKGRIVLACCLTNRSGHNFFFCQFDFLGIQTFNGNIAMLVKLQWESPSALR